MEQESKYHLFYNQNCFSDVTALSGGIETTIEDGVGMYNLGIYYIGGGPQPAIQ